MLSDLLVQMRYHHPRNPGSHITFSDHWVSKDTVSQTPSKKRSYQSRQVKMFLRGMRGQRRPRSDFANAQSDQGLRCPHTESLDTIECFNRTNARMRLCACAG